MGTFRFWVISCVVPVLAAACAPYEANVTVGSPRPSRARRPSVETQSKVGEPTADASLDGTVVSVSVRASELCRERVTRPAVADQTTTRTISKTGTYYQWALGGGAVVAGLLGARMAFGPCEKEEDGPTPQDEPITRPCTESELKDTKSGGYGLLALAGGLSIPFIINAAGGGTETSTVEAPPMVSFGSWKRCGREDLEGEGVELVFSDGQVTKGRLDSRGRAQLDFTAITATVGIGADAVAKIWVRKHLAGTVDIRKTELYARSAAAAKNAEANRSTALCAALGDHAARATELKECIQRCVDDEFTCLEKSGCLRRGQGTLERLQALKACPESIHARCKNDLCSELCAAKSGDLPLEAKCDRAACNSRIPKAAGVSDLLERSARVNECAAGCGPVAAALGCAR